MKRFLAVLGVVLGVGVPAAPAAAAERNLGRPSVARIAAGPDLAGDTVLWGARGGREHVVLRAPIRRGRARELVRLLPLSEGDETSMPALAASPEGYTFSFASGGGRRGTNVSTEAGLFGGTRRSFGCTAGGSDIDGTRVVGGCNAELLDLASDAPARKLSDAPAGLPRIAGGFVAWSERPSPTVFREDVVVYDLTADRIAYRVDAGGRIHDLAVQADGTVVFAHEVETGDPPSMRVSTGSVADPVRRTLPLPRAALYGVKIAGGRVAFARARLNSRRVRVGVIGLDGRRLRERSAYGGFGSFDFDGSRLAWFARPRRAVLLRVERV